MTAELKATFIQIQEILRDVHHLPVSLDVDSFAIFRRLNGEYLAHPIEVLDALNRTIAMPAHSINASEIYAVSTQLISAEDQPVAVPGMLAASVKCFVAFYTAILKVRTARCARI